MLADDFEAAAIKPLIIECTDFFFAEHQREEANWPAVTDCDRLDRAFEELEARGVVCRQDFSCCGTCAAGEIRDEMETTRQSGVLVRGYAYYHMQDTESAVEGGGVYLGYGASDEGELAALRIGHEICDALQSQGLSTDWDGSWSKRIFVKLDWKRRRYRQCRRA